MLISVSPLASTYGQGGDDHPPRHMSNTRPYVGLHFASASRTTHPSSMTLSASGDWHTKTQPSREDQQIPTCLRHPGHDDGRYNADETAALRTINNVTNMTSKGTGKLTHSIRRPHTDSLDIRPLGAPISPRHDSASSRQGGAQDPPSTSTNYDTKIFKTA